METSSERLTLSSILSLLGLLNPNASPASKAFSGVSAASQAANAAGSIASNPAVSEVGQGLGTAGALAALGYNVADIASNKDYSDKQKAGHSANALIQAALGTAFPIYGLGEGVGAAGQAMEHSGSPTVRGFGKTLDYGITPGYQKLGYAVLEGDKSPKAAFRSAMSDPYTFTDMVLGPMGGVVRGLGLLDHKPTTGTMFRRELGRIFDKTGIKGANLGAYNVDLSKFTPDEIAKANQIAGAITPYSPTAKGHPANNYITQTAAILLNSFGKDQPSLASLGTSTRR